MYSINTSVTKVKNKTPFEIVFGQRPRSDFEMRRIFSESGIEDEENLPDDFIYEVNGCKFYIRHIVFRKSFVSFLSTSM